MEQPKLLKELFHQIKDNKLLSNHGNMARTSGINGSKNSKAGANNEVTSFTIGRYNKRGCNAMVKTTAMVYKVMEEQHKIDIFVLKEPAILKDEMHLNEFALQLCCTHGIPECDTNSHPTNIFEMNTSIATLSIQCSDENSLYLEGTRVNPSASLVMLTTRMIRNIMICGSSTSMCRTPTPTFGFVWAMCLPIASHVVIT